MKTRYITIQDCLDRAALIARLLAEDKGLSNRVGLPIRVFGIPRGGYTVAYMVVQALRELGWGLEAEVVYDPTIATVIVDDLVDSGATRQQYTHTYPEATFMALFAKDKEDTDWYTFPWEVTQGNKEKETIQDNVTRILQYIGEDTTRQGLLETPNRVAKSWKEMTAGYRQNVEDVLTVFEDGAEGVDEMVIVKDIPFYSNCMHHMIPFFGTVDIAYIPNGKVLGLSKFKRLTDIFAKRLQVQEALTQQIANTLMLHLDPIGVAVHIKARHLCMEARGVCTQGSETETTALLGAFKDKPETRAEFIARIS